ncbi:MAG: OmpA family protein, partial [Selenomonadaceae bacterium]|nr:OmpA family protein [Selenomonadaceae bacterium]
FICLFAISQTDQTKLVQMAQAFTAAFNMGGPSFFDKAGPSNSMTREIITSEDQGNSAYLQENQQLQDLQQKLEEYIRENNLQDELSTQLEEEGLMIRIKERALFPSGSADLVPESQRIGPIVAGLLAEVPERVLISGHTDTDPINTAQFPSNWELSSVRAMTFMKYLLSINQNLNPARFSAIGYGEYRPIAMNDTPDNKQKNRRVEILIARSLTFNPNEGFRQQTDADLVAK